jgi:hypothetical protein
MCKQRSVQNESVYSRRVAANTGVNWLSDYVKSCNINLLHVLWNTIDPIIGSDSNTDEADPLFNPFTNSELEGVVVSITFRPPYFLEKDRY